MGSIMSAIADDEDFYVKVCILLNIKEESSMYTHMNVLRQKYTGNQNCSDWELWVAINEQVKYSNVDNTIALLDEMEKKLEDEQKEV